MTVNGTPYISGGMTRTTGTQSRNTILSNIRRTNNAIMLLQEQLSTGRRLVRPSIDPVDANAVMKYESHIKNAEQFQRSSGRVLNKFNYAASVLENLTKVTNSAREIGLQQASDTSSAQTRSLAAQSVSELIQEAMDIANTMYEGKFIFGGSLANEAPFELSGNSVLYKGDAREIDMNISTTSSVPSNMPGTELFGALTAAIESNADLDANITYGGAFGAVTAGGASGQFIDTALIGKGQNVFEGLEATALTGANAGEKRVISGFNNVTGTVTFASAFTNNFAATDTYEIKGASTRLADLNNGDGVSAGSIEIFDGTRTIAIDLQTANTIADVVDRINGAFSAFGTISAGINAAGNGLLVDSTSGTLTIEETGGGRTASMLGIEKTVAAGGQKVGTDLDAQISLFTPLTLLNAGAGIDRSAGSGIRIVNGDQQKDIDVTGLYTVKDLVNAIEQTGINASAEVAQDGKGISVFSRLIGDRLKIEETGAGSTAQDLGILYTLDRAKLSDLNNGAGVDTSIEGNDFRVTLMSGSTIDIDINGAETVQDVIDIINNNSQNISLGSPLLAQVDPATGDKIQLLDTSADANSDFKVETLNGSLAAEDLGILQTIVNPPGADVSLTLTGRDLLRAGVEADSIFTSLIKLRKALEANDTGGIQNANANIEYVGDRDVLEGIAVIGSRASRLEMANTRSEEEAAQLDVLVSSLRDIDVAEAATAFQLEQIILQASLSAASRILQLNLINFL
ncbi:MAG: flagellar hook-associated protein FlgL [Planctomycetes bacterium]|nr:flagellar hook-associated protein FlgL [Planctomycetota bacterium]